MTLGKGWIPRYDEIGPWSERKLEIIRKYAAAFSTVMTSQGFRYVYIDAFAGSGTHISKTTRKLVPGSSLSVLQVDPPFAHYYFVDTSASKLEELTLCTNERTDVTILRGDCNEILPRDVFPQVQYKRYERGLCFLDPYGAHVKWSTIEAAADTKAIDIMLNFSVLDINRNMYWRSGVNSKQEPRLTALWGDASWGQLYDVEPGLFSDMAEKKGNEALANAYAKRLRDVAGFKHSARPLEVRNKSGAVMYYLLFASHKPLAVKIANDIFKYYRKPHDIKGA